MSNYLDDRKEARELVIEKYTKNGSYLIGHENGELYCADNYNHLLELHKNHFNDEPLVLLAINEDDAKELQDDWKLDNEGIPCPAIKMIGKEGVHSIIIGTKKLQKEAIEIIKELKDFSMMDQMIEDWKKEDDMDGPLSWALGLRERVNEFLKEVES